MNQIVVLIVFVVVIDEVSEMVFASGSSMAILLDFRFVVLTGELEGGFAGFEDLLAGQVGFGVLFFDFLLAFWLIILTDGTFVWGVIQQIDGERFEFGQNVGGPGNSLVVLQRLVVLSIYTNFDGFAHRINLLFVVFDEFVLKSFYFNQILLKNLL